MADLQLKDSGAEVKEIQQRINAYYNADVVPESGEFDTKTEDGVETFQKDMKLRVTGVVDDRTLKLLLNPPKVTAHRVKYGSLVVFLTDEQYDGVLKALAKAAAPTVDGFQRKAQEARFLWDALNDTRKSTFFLTREMVDVWCRMPFPNEAVIKASESAVAKMQAALRGNDADALSDALTDGQSKVSAATIAIRNYREAFYGGGESLIKTLEVVVEGCKVVVEACAAIATGGASIEVQASVMAGVGSYKSLLDQIDKASKTSNFNIVSAAGNVLIDGAVGGVTAALLGNGSFVGGITDNVGKTIGGMALKRYGSDLAAKVAEKAVKKALDGAIKAAVKDMVESCKPGSKMTLDEAVKDISKEFLKSGALGGLSGGLEKQLDGLSENATKYFKPGVFKGLGDVDPKKAFAAGGDQIIDEAVTRLGGKIILAAADDPRKIDQVPKALADEIASDAKVNKALADLVAKKKLK